jgi:hypothetical protein
MVANAQKGDYQAAAESANKILNGPITDPDNPLRKAATAIIMQPVENIKELYKQHKAGGESAVGAAAGTANDILNPGTRLTNAIHRVVPKVKADYKAGNISGAIGDVIGGANSPETGAIPLVGGMVQQIAGNLDTDLHNHNYGAVLGDVTGPVATAGIGKALGAIGEAGEAAGGAEAGAEAGAVPETTGAPPPPPPGGAEVPTTGTPPPPRPMAPPSVKPSGNPLTRSAELVRKMNERAPGPTKEATAQTVQDTVAGAKAPEQAATDLEANSQQQALTAEQQAVQDNYNRAHTQITQEGAGAQNAANQARGVAETEKSLADESLTNFAKMAPGDESITAAAKTAADTANKAMHEKYVAQQGKLIEMTGDTSVPVEGSPIHEAFNDLTGASEAKGSVTGAVAKSLPGSAVANDTLKGIEKLIEPEEPAEGEEPAPPATTDMKDLLEAYQRIGAKQRATAWNTETGPADQQIYSRLKQGIIDTVAQIAQKSGNPEAIDVAQKMNSDYRAEVGLYENPAVKALRSGKMTDVDKALTGGQASLGNINAMRQVLGSHWQDFTQNSLKRMVADQIGEDGTINYKGLLNKLNGINPDVRTALYGDAQAGDLLKSLNTATKASADAATATADSEAAAGATQDRLEGAGKTAAGKTKELQAASENVTKEQAAKTKAINESIAGIVGDGDVAKLLQDPTRRAALQEAVGPDGMAKLGDLAIENQISKATGEVRDGQFVKGRFDPDKFLKWTESFKDSPEALDSTFRMTPERAAAYDKLITSMQEASSVKKLVRFGVLPPAAAAVGVLSGGPLVGVLATAASVLGEARWAPLQEFLDTVANHPATWKTIGVIGKTAEAAKRAASVAPTAAKVAGKVLNKTPTAAKIATYGALAGALGGPEAEDKEVVPADQDTGQQGVTLPVTK